MKQISASTPLVLGSGSPRRRAFLEQVGLAHVVVVVGTDEAMRPNEEPDAYLARIVEQKLDAVRQALTPNLAKAAAALLVADTIVLDGPIVLGKPADKADARRRIEQLAGRVHEVRTRFALGLPDRLEPLHEETVATKITFRAISAREAARYAESGEGLDKAGAYAVQGAAASFVSRVEGSYTNVVGLPLSELVVALQRLGLMR